MNIKRRKIHLKKYYDLHIWWKKEKKITIGLELLIAICISGFVNDFVSKLLKQDSFF